MMTNIYLCGFIIVVTIAACGLAYLTYTIHKDNNIIQENNSKIMGMATEQIFVDGEVRALEQQNMWLEVDRRIDAAIKKHELEQHTK